VKQRGGGLLGIPSKIRVHGSTISPLGSGINKMVS
jgi:hypothetical protein